MHRQRFLLIEINCVLSPSYRALNLKCTNAKHPDLYGHYREAKFTQTKHHWWWKANWVFNQLSVTRNHTGMVLFLEEDHYVAEDFLHVLRLMERTCKLNCERCNVLSLGTYLKTYNYFTDFSRKVRPSFLCLTYSLNFALRDVPCTRDKDYKYGRVHVNGRRICLLGNHIGNAFI